MTPNEMPEDALQGKSWVDSGRATSVEVFLVDQQSVWLGQGPEVFYPPVTRSRSKLIIGMSALATVVAGLLGMTVVYSLSEGPPNRTGSERITAPPTAVTAHAPSAPAISWSVVGGIPVPVSSAAGPRNSEGGRAVGFSHDAVGAALAAVNISFRLTSNVGPQVYEPTVREQCFGGDVEATLEQIRHSSIQGSVSEFWYKVTSGDPDGGLVLISIAVKTPQSGGYVGSERTLRWVDGDWRMQLPAPPPEVIPSVSGYTLLGRPGG